MLIYGAAAADADSLFVNNKRTHMVKYKGRKNNPTYHPPPLCTQPPPTHPCEPRWLPAVTSKIDDSFLICFHVKPTIFSLIEHITTVH